MIMSDSEQRPKKILKLSLPNDTLSSPNKWTSESHTSFPSSDTKSKSHGRINDHGKRGKTSRNNDSNHQDTQRGNSKPHKSAIFSQPSTICAGDRGIFVTSDKGREKKCLLELRDLLQDLTYQEDDGGNSCKVGQVAPRSIGPAPSGPNGENSSIENDIESELAELRGETGKGLSTVHSSSMFSLITLDIPCVSFVRFSTDIKQDPSELVYSICNNAARDVANQKSRYIKRLTPVSMLGKALSNGLEIICEKVLPKHFGIKQFSETVAVSYAIRPTIRNNDKLNRDIVIKTVAGYVEKLCKGTAKVDLKGYQKGVLIEVYRGWVGIGVVNNAAMSDVEEDQKDLGYEALRRYNLAEIYTDTQQRGENT